MCHRSDIFLFLLLFLPLNLACWGIGQSSQNRLRPHFKTVIPRTYQALTA